MLGLKISAFQLLFLVQTTAGDLLYFDLFQANLRSSMLIRHCISRALIQAEKQFRQAVIFHSAYM